MCDSHSCADGRFVSEFVKRFDNVRRYGLLSEQDVWTPLVVNPWCGDSLLKWEAKVNVVDDSLDDLGDDGWTTGCAKCHDRLAILEDDCG